jgi:hypothetical protein
MRREAEAVMVRNAVRRGAERVAEMVRQLARAAHAGEPPTFTAADFRRDGLGAKARFRCVVVELSGRLVGYATWKQPTTCQAAHMERTCWIFS